ncbi:MAG: HupE/UreJ family protein [Hyphomicrobium sp.]|jgi:urease accessory protein
MKTNSLVRWLGAAVTLAVALSTPAAAHVGVGDAHGFARGFAHPIGGLDHVLAMIAVGIFAANLGGRALWLVPATFVLMMAVGGAIGIAGIDLPYVEIGIAISVIVLGTAVALRTPLPTVAAMSLVGFFAVFHGHAHGAEMPADASGMGYAEGFMLATALLHMLGVGIGLLIGRIGSGAARVSQIGGTAMSVTGLALLAGLF